MATISGRLVNYLERLLSIQSHEISRDHSQTNGISLLSHYISIPERPGGPCPPLLFSTFLRSKKKKRETKKKRKGCFKAETIKRLSPRSKCYCFSHSRASRIQLFFVGQPRQPTILFSVPWPSTFKSISQALILYISTYATRFL